MSLVTGNRIRKIREFRSYTQEYMAEKLDLAQNTYSKMETGQTKIDTDQLKQISNILGVPVDLILSDESLTFNVSNQHVEKFYNHIETLQDENRELAQKTIQILQDQIDRLSKENERLMSMLEKGR